MANQLDGSTCHLAWILNLGQGGGDILLYGVVVPHFWKLGVLSPLSISAASFNVACAFVICLLKYLLTYLLT